MGVTDDGIYERCFFVLREDVDIGARLAQEWYCADRVVFHCSVEDFGLCDAINISGETDNSRCEVKGICSCFPCYIFLELFGRYLAPVRVGRLREKWVTSYLGF